MAALGACSSLIPKNPKTFLCPASEMSTVTKATLFLYSLAAGFKASFTLSVN